MEGKRWFVDLRNVKWAALGRKKFWILFVNYKTNYCVSHFIKHKDNLEVEGLKIFKKVCAMNIQVKMIRMDNAGDNRLLQKALEQEEFNIDFQCMVAGTPQQNSQVKRKFTTLYGKVCSTLNVVRIVQGLHHKLWAECAAHVTNMENTIVSKAKKSSLF